MELPEAAAPVVPAAGGAAPTYTLSGEYHLHPTPAGTYYAVSRPDPTPRRRFLQKLLACRVTPTLTVDWLEDATGLSGAPALAFLHELQAAGHVQGLPQPMEAPREAAHLLFPALLAPLSDEGRAVLADAHSLLLAAVGWKHGHCEQLAALGGQLTLLLQRHAALRDELALESDGWGLASAAGFTELTFWPLHLGTSRYHLVIGGQPQFNQQAYTRLAWALAQRTEGAQR